MRIAVVGANGFIGARAVEMLTLNGLAEVRPIVRSYTSLTRLSRFPLDARVADAFDPVALETALQGCDVVVHAVAGDIRTILGTLTPVYQAAERAGVRRLVYLSSGSVHGQSPTPGTDEDSPLSDRQPLAYNNAKVRAEGKLRALREKGKTELVILRPGIVLGPRSSWITRFADDLLAGGAALLDRGRGICNSIYVDNLIHAVYLAATVPEADRKTFLVGDEEQVSWADVYRPIAEALGFDFQQIPEGQMLERMPEEQALEEKPSLFQRLEPVRNSRVVQGLLSVFPHRLRLAAFLAYQAILEPQAVFPAEAAAQPQPTISPEMAMLYSCQYKLPHAKAAKCLGYVAPVSFPVAMERTLAWLAFAGYPVKKVSRIGCKN